jgi:D-psicose/D-tagatose/L-ribulose 3-epimerase
MALYRFAICNELFQGEPLPAVCKDVRRLGYDGFEIAPFTLSEDPAALSSERRMEVKTVIESEGLSFVGLHWLLAVPPGLHIATRDEVQRRRTWDYVRALIDLCADFTNPASGRPPVVVFGSPKQRSSTPGTSASEAVKILTEEFARAAPHAEARGVKLLVEALSPTQTDVVTSLAEAVEIVKQIANPAVETMFDVHNAIDETVPHTDLIRAYRRYIRHVHVNELDGREPGMGDYDFGSLLQVLEEIDYAGWVSLEAFDFSRDPREVAGRAIGHLRAL